MSFPANDLERALAAAAERSQIDEAFLRVVATAPLLVPMTDHDGRFVLIAHHDGQYVAAFTSPTQLEQAQAGSGAQRQLTGAELVALLDDATGIAINPGGDVGVALTPGEARRLSVTAAVQRVDLPTGTTVHIGHPTVEPEDLLDQLSAQLAAEPDVVAAHRVLVQIGTEPPRLVIAVTVNDDRRDPGALAARLLVASTPERPVDVVVSVSAEPGDDLAGVVRAGGRAFYSADSA